MSPAPSGADALECARHHRLGRIWASPDLVDTSTEAILPRRGDQWQSEQAVKRVSVIGGRSAPSTRRRWSSWRVRASARSAGYRTDKRSSVPDSRLHGGEVAWRVAHNAALGALGSPRESQRMRHSARSVTPAPADLPTGHSASLRSRNSGAQSGRDGRSVPSSELRSGDPGCSADSRGGRRRVYALRVYDGRGSSRSPPGPRCRR